MKLNQLLMALMALFICFSCSSDDSESSNTQVTFSDIEKQLDMKGNFSELSRKNILRHYHTTDNFLTQALKRKEELSSKKNTKKSISQKMMSAYIIDAIDPLLGLGSVSFMCWDDEYIIDAYEDEGYGHFTCDRLGMSTGCLARLVHGKVDQSDQSFLNDDEMEYGWVLICRAYPKLNCGFLFRQEANFEPL
ncbi:2Fe-2S iron-sulfur cluster-binding protein [Flavobacterium ajazii]|nr:2Fe-2S iron-sulfur cluster-binding protein [Flavobacterium ajazii]